MAVQVLIPTPLQKFTNEEATASLEASSIDELLQALEGRYPGLLNRLCVLKERRSALLDVLLARHFGVCGRWVSDV